MKLCGTASPSITPEIVGDWVRKVPMSTAASRAEHPTAPVPKITMEDPTSGRSTLSTAPAPVVSPQQSGPRSSSGTTATEVAGGKVLAVCRMPGAAVCAHPAGVEDEHHVVPGCNRGHALAHGIHDPGKTDPGTAAAPTKITVGVIPIVDTAPIWLGVKQGFFTAEGLDVTVQPTTGGAASVPGVVAGSYDFAFGNYISGMVANDKGLGLKYVTNGNSAAGDPDFGAVIVPGDSPIKRPADLSGKTISVNNLQNIGDTTIRTVVDNDGGDSSKIKFVEVAFPDAEAAVANKQVDAAWILAPFLNSAVANGARVITYNFSAFNPKLDIAGYFTKATTFKEKPELVKSFQKAMNKSLEYASTHPDEVKQIVTTYTKMTAAQLDSMVLPKFNVEFNRSALTELGAAAAKYGTISKAPNLDELLP